MQKFGLAVDHNSGVRGAVSTVLQRQVEATVGGRPLGDAETRGIRGMPNHFIGALGKHNYRDHVASTTVGRQVIFIHEVPSDDTPSEPIFLSHEHENDASVHQV